MWQRLKARVARNFSSVFMDPKGIEISCRNHRCIHQLFEEQVERTPENTGFIFANESLTAALPLVDDLTHILIEAGMNITNESRR